MFKKMMKHLVNNPGLKILSVLFSVVLWLVVVNMADPEATKSFSVPVEILNKNVITEMGKVPDIIGDTDIAVFYITGARSYVEDMGSDDFSVTADLSQVDLSQDGEAKLVPIEIAAKKNEKRIDITRKTVNMQIKLEELSERKFVISPETIGTPADGCAIGTVEVIPNLLKISGPESIVSSINRVTTSINVDGISSDVSDNVMPVLYDENGKTITSELLEMNQGTVTIRANILGTKSVSVRCQVSGTPADGYQYRGVEFAPETVLVKGEAALLNGINVINIPADVINIDGAKSDLDTTIDITPYLGDGGISLVDETANQIAVKVLIEQKETKNFHLSMDDIVVTGLNSNYEFKFNGNNVSITVRALKENMETLEAEDIKAALDLTGLEPGVHNLELNITLPNDKFELSGNVNVQLTIEDKTVEPEESEESENNRDETQENDTNSRDEEDSNRDDREDREDNTEDERR